MQEKVYSSVPVNKLAKLVVSKPEFEDNIEYNTINRTHSDSPLPTEHIKVSNRVHILTGKRFGNFVVQGAFLLVNPRKNRQWVVQCDCGRYKTRTRKNLLRKDTIGNCCIICQSVISKLQQAEERKIIDIQGKEESIVYTLGEYMGNGIFRGKVHSRYTKQLKIGDVMYNSHNLKDTIINVSNARITFENKRFKSGQRVYLYVTEEEVKERSEGDFRK